MLRLFSGFPLILLTRLVCKKIVRSAVFEFCRLLSLEAYSYSDYRKVTVQLNKHYIDGFKIPAQQDELKAKTAGIVSSLIFIYMLLCRIEKLYKYIS